MAHSDSKEEDNVGRAWLACQVASHICALPLTRVVETMRPLPVEQFPKAPRFVSGIAIIRGEPAAVVNMRALLDEADAPSERYVTLRIDGRLVALAVDAVRGVHNLNGSQTIALPPLLQRVADEAVSQVAARDAELLLFLEASRLLPPGLIESIADQSGAP